MDSLATRARISALWLSRRDWAVISKTVDGVRRDARGFEVEAEERERRWWLDGRYTPICGSFYGLELRGQAGQRT